MLELRPTCENCSAALPPSSTMAYICSHECTFCEQCAMDLFQNVCPNCGGGFERRPVRPKESLARFSSGTKETHKPADMKSHAKLSQKYKNIPPEQR
jgi:hypothetical protein